MMYKRLSNKIVMMMCQIKKKERKFENDFELPLIAKISI